LRPNQALSPNKMGDDCVLKALTHVPLGSNVPHEGMKSITVCCLGNTEPWLERQPAPNEIVKLRAEIVRSAIWASKRVVPAIEALMMVNELRFD